MHTAEHGRAVPIAPIARIAGGFLMARPVAAVRVAATIGAAKWTLVSLLALFGVGSLVMSMAAAASGDSAALSFAVFIVCTIYAVLVWVLFGWFEHTLRLLSSIATNTQQHQR
jgi:hypothetical protein